MGRVALMVVLLLTICACSRSAKNRDVTWIPVDGITVTSEPDGKAVLTSADLKQAMIVVEERPGRANFLFMEEPQRKSTIWFQLTNAAARRYRAPVDGERWTLRLRGTVLAPATDQPMMGSFANNYRFCMADDILPGGKRLSEIILIRQDDASESTSHANRLRAHIHPEGLRIP
jgi:hypothetical protein